MIFVIGLYQGVLQNVYATNDKDKAINEAKSLCKEYGIHFRNKSKHKEIQNFYSSGDEENEVHIIWEVWINKLWG